MAASPSPALLPVAFPIPVPPRLEQLAGTLLRHQTAKETRKQVAQLQGELRDDFKTRARGVKADYMARVVSFADAQDGSESAAPAEVEEQLGRTSLADGGDNTSPPAPLLLPTILSDADETAKMSAAVDAQVEQSVRKHMEDAGPRIEAAVARQKTMELELWIGQTVLEALDQAEGDEEGAARLLEIALEDRLFDEGVPLPASTPSA
ncbi:hypothetical protein JCM10213_003435 [Rhodosporidiobolus nylandii]